MKLFKRRFCIPVSRWVGVLALVLMALVAPATASAQDHLIETALFEDDTGAMGFDDVRQQRFVEQAQPLLLGSAGTSHWIRLKVGAHQALAGAPPLDGLGSAHNKQLVLLINPPYVGQVSCTTPQIRARSRARPVCRSRWNKPSFRSATWPSWCS